VPAGKVKQHLSAGPGVRRDDGAYEIPITSPLLPSRKPMRRVALPTQRKREGHSASPLITTHRSTSCWTSSCWPSASASSGWRWDTPTPANDY